MGTDFFKTRILTQTTIVKPSTPDWMSNFLSANQNLVRFDRFMQAALYDPVHGYYSRADRVFGPEGDFVTAPELSSLFGRTLACALREAVRDCGGHIWEFGAGRGLLARDILTELGDEVTCYHIVDVSGALQTLQRETLQAGGIDTDARVRWETQLPDTLEGVLIGNEVLDAMPVRLFAWNAGTVCERFVGLSDAAQRTVAWQDLPPDDELRHAVESLHQTHGPWPDDYVSEWPEQAIAFVRTITQALKGVALFVDYGFGAGEFYHPQRSTGTLVAHHRHKMSDEVLDRPGEQDITAHVDFSALFEAQHAAGGELLGYTSQAAFLLHNGLLEKLDASASPARRQAIQTLVNPSEMGELFKVMAWCRGVNPDHWALTRTLAQMDRSRQL